MAAGGGAREAWPPSRKWAAGQRQDAPSATAQSALGILAGSLLSQQLAGALDLSRTVLLVSLTHPARASRGDEGAT
jgi:hypothetical protein